MGSREAGLLFRRRQYIAGWLLRSLFGGWAVSHSPTRVFVTHMGGVMTRRGWGFGASPQGASAERGLGFGALASSHPKKQNRLLGDPGCAPDGGGLPTHLAHAFEDEGGVAGHALGAALEGSGEDGGELGGLLAADAAG
jgi:hypothetical protein